MDVMTVRSRLTVAQQAGDTSEVAQCERFMLEHFLELQRSGQLLPQLDRATLGRLVQSDDLRADECSVLEACLEWARHRVAMSEGEGKESERVRAELGEMIYRIRFPLMSLETFSKLMSSGSVDMLTADEKLMLVDYMMNKSGRKQLKFDHRIRPAATGLPSYRNEYVVSRYRGDSAAPGLDEKENLNKDKETPNKLSESSAGKPLQTRSHRNNYPARYDYNWLSTGSLNRFILQSAEPADSGFRIDAIDFQTDRDIHVTALGLYAGKLSNAIHDGNKHRAEKLTNQDLQDQTGKLIDGDITPPSPARDGATVSAHSVVLEIFEAGHPMMGTPTRQHKSYQGSDGQAGQPVRVELREPVLVRGGAKYTIVIKATGSATYRGTDGQDEIAIGVAKAKVGVTNGGGPNVWADGDSESRVRFNFFKSDKDFSNTDTNSGQIPQIYFII